MSDIAPAGSTPAAVVAGSGGAQQQGNASSGTGTTGVVLNTGSNTQAASTPANTDWRAALSPQMRELADKKGWQSPDAVLGSYAELERAFSSRGPNTQQTAQQTGQPKFKSSEYEFTKPQNASDIGYNDEFASNFKSWAHAADVDPKSAASLHDNFVEWAAGTVQRTRAQQAQARRDNAAAAETALRSAWKSQPEFSHNMEMAQRAMRNLSPDLMGVLTKMGALASVDGRLTVMEPVIIQAFAKVGDQMFKEDSLFGQSALNVNPFDPKTEDMTAQGRMIRDDPAKAEQLIRAAGPKATQMYAHWLSTRGKR
jgi:hypothetical protein